MGIGGYITFLYQAGISEKRRLETSNHRTAVPTVRWFTLYLLRYFCRFMAIYTIFRTGSCLAGITFPEADVLPGFYYLLILFVNLLFL